VSSTNEKGPTIIRANTGWTAVGERFAAGGATIAAALSNYWNLVKTADAQREPGSELLAR